MKRYPSYESLPAHAIYIGTDDRGPGSMSETLADHLDTAYCDKALVYIVDQDGFRSFFAI